MKKAFLGSISWREDYKSSGTPWLILMLKGKLSKINVEIQVDVELPCESRQVHTMENFCCLHQLKLYSRQSTILSFPVYACKVKQLNSKY